MSTERKSEIARLRTDQPEFRVQRSEGSKPVLTGYAAVFDQKIDFGPFTESVARGAFQDSLANKDDVRALFNHDPNFVLGRSTNGSLLMEEDSKGLLVRIELPDTQFARDLAVSVDRGDVSQMSFGFWIEAEEMIRNEGEKTHFKIVKAKLFDVSPVTFPAYPTTEVELQRQLRGRGHRVDDRRAIDALAEKEKRERELFLRSVACGQISRG